MQSLEILNQPPQGREVFVSFGGGSPRTGKNVEKHATDNGRTAYVKQMCCCRPAAELEGELLGCTLCTVLETNTFNSHATRVREMGAKGAGNSFSLVGVVTAAIRRLPAVGGGPLSTR